MEEAIEKFIQNILALFKAFVIACAGILIAWLISKVFWVNAPAWYSFLVLVGAQGLVVWTYIRIIFKK